MRPLPLVAGSGTAMVLAASLAHAQLFTFTKEQLLAYTAQNTFERFEDGRPKVPDALIERAKGLSSEEILAVLPGKGYRNQYVDGFQVLHPGKKLVGRAFTVQFMPVRPDVEEVTDRQRQEGRHRAPEQPVRHRHAPARRRARRRSLRQEGRRHHRRRQPVLLRDEGDEERRPGGGRGDPRSRRHRAACRCRRISGTRIRRQSAT